MFFIWYYSHQGLTYYLYIFNALYNAVIDIFRFPSKLWYYKRNWGVTSFEFKKGKEARCLLRYRQGRLLMCILTNYGRIFIFDLCLIRYITKSCISIFRHIVMYLLQLMRKNGVTNVICIYGMYWHWTRLFIIQRWKNVSKWYWLQEEMKR